MPEGNVTFVVLSISGDEGPLRVFLVQGMEQEMCGHELRAATSLGVFVGIRCERESEKNRVSRLSE